LSSLQLFKMDWLLIMMEIEKSIFSLSPFLKNIKVRQKMVKIDAILLKNFISLIRRLKLMAFHLG